MKTANQQRPASERAQPIRLRTWDEYSAYLAEHLKPVRRGPKGQPIYDAKEVAALNIILPDSK